MDPFALIWAKINFLFLSVFKYSNYIPSCKKSRKADEKCQTDRWADSQRERKTENSDFIEPSAGQGSKNVIDLLCF